MLKGVKIGKYFVPMWIIIILLVAGIGASAYYVWQTLTIQLEIKEPLEIIFYPSQLSLYPGETKEFNVTIKNYASVNYFVLLEFYLGNTTYQKSYVTFSPKVYNVIPGKQNLTIWLKVKPDAPPTSTSLTVVFKRLTTGVLFFDDFNDDLADGWTENMGTWDVTNGKYRVSVPRRIEYGISIVDFLNLTNCVIETKVMFIDDVGYRAGIVFRYIDNEHYYSFELSNEYDNGDLIRYDPTNPIYGSGFASIGGANSYPLQKNVEYLIKVEVKGNVFRCFINGVEVFSGRDETYGYGKVGLRAQGAIVFFDDFKVTEIP